MMVRRDLSPLAAHSASPVELTERLRAERNGVPFLLFREPDGQRIVTLPDGDKRVTIGRLEGNDLALVWDPQVSGLHAALERLGSEWTLFDDGLSRNGSFVNGARVTRRQLLRNGDSLRFGSTVIVYCAPRTGTTMASTVTADSPLRSAKPTDAQRRVLLALCRPFRESSFAAPASNREIAAELVVSVQAVKAQLHALYERFGIDELPQNQKRAQLAWAALQQGLITPRDLWD